MCRSIRRRSYPTEETLDGRASSTDRDDPYPRCEIGGPSGRLRAPGGAHVAARGPVALRGAGGEGRRPPTRSSRATSPARRRRKDWDAAVAVARQLAARARIRRWTPTTSPACCRAPAAGRRRSRPWRAAPSSDSPSPRRCCATTTSTRSAAQAGYDVALDRVRRNNAAELELAKPRLASAPLLTLAPKPVAEGAPPGTPPLIVALPGFGGTPRRSPGLPRLGPPPRARSWSCRAAGGVGRGFGSGIVGQAEYLVEQAIARRRRAASRAGCSLDFSRGGRRPDHGRAPSREGTPA